MVFAEPGPGDATLARAGATGRARLLPRRRRRCAAQPERCPPLSRRRSRRGGPDTIRWSAATRQRRRARPRRAHRRASSTPARCRWRGAPCRCPAPRWMAACAVAALAMRAAGHRVPVPAAHCAGGAPAAVDADLAAGAVSGRRAAGGFRSTTSRRRCSRASYRRTLAGKLVLVGSSAAGVFDLRSTPVAAVFPGVEVHASPAVGPARWRGPVTPDWVRGYEVLQLLVVAALLALLLPRLPARAIAATLACCSAQVALDQWLYRRHGLALPLASALLLTALVYAGISPAGARWWKATRRELARLFGTYVPPELIAQMARPASATACRPRTAFTILFCDMRNFTRLRVAAAEELRKRSSTASSAMTEEIRAHRGTLDKYIGDAIMAFWAPGGRRRPRAARRRAAMLGRIWRGSTASCVSAACRNRRGHRHQHRPRSASATWASDIRRSYTVMGDAWSTRLAHREADGRLRHRRATRRGHASLSERGCRWSMGSTAFASRRSRP